MNAERRKVLDKAETLISEARELLEQVKDEEQEYFDNMPESLQSGERGQKAEQCVDLIDDLVNAIDSFDFEEVKA